MISVLDLPFVADKLAMLSSYENYALDQAFGEQRKNHGCDVSSYANDSVTRNRIPIIIQLVNTSLVTTVDGYNNKHWRYYEFVIQDALRNTTYTTIRWEPSVGWEPVTAADVCILPDDHMFRLYPGSSMFVCVSDLIRILFSVVKEVTVSGYSVVANPASPVVKALEVENNITFDWDL